LKRIKSFKDLKVNLSVDKVPSNICIKVKMLLKPTNDMKNFLLLLYYRYMLSLANIFLTNTAIVTFRKSKPYI